MAATILDGKALAATMQAEIAAGVAALLASGGPRPGLAAVLIGDDPASQVYVRNKRLACERAGMASRLHALPASTTQDDLLDLVDRLNDDASVHGILVQLPLPKQIEDVAVIEEVSPLKVLRMPL